MKKCIFTLLLGLMSFLFLPFTPAVEDMSPEADHSLYAEDMSFQDIQTCESFISGEDVQFPGGVPVLMDASGSAIVFENDVTRSMALWTDGNWLRQPPEQYSSKLHFYSDSWPWEETAIWV